ncbi:hypothetical protein K5Q02_21275 [Pseudomonas sp. MM211]|nr:hypothetical protein K5Q02_21275 [Pseudomonas sp. MM211]
MSNATGKVVMLHPRDSRAALESLNRITGLRFSHWPESLVCVMEKGVPSGTLSSPVEPGVDAPASQAFA